jgi:hypothetical protein
MADDTNDPQVTELPALLRSGRRVSLVTSNHSEELRVVGPDGTVELAVILTPEGPVLRLRGARLEIDSTDSIAVRCRSFELQTEGALSLQAGGDLALSTAREIHAKSMGQTFIDGDYVNLNCGDRTGYHDEGAAGADDDSRVDPNA